MIRMCTKHHHEWHGINCLDCRSITGRCTRRMTNRCHMASGRGLENSQQKNTPICRPPHARTGDLLRFEFSISTAACPGRGVRVYRWHQRSEYSKTHIRKYTARRGVHLLRIPIPPRGGDTECGTSPAVCDRIG